jgi:hypothetical protein
MNNSDIVVRIASIVGSDYVMHIVFMLWRVSVVLIILCCAWRTMREIYIHGILPFIKR